MSIKLSVPMFIGSIFEAYEKGKTQGAADLEHRVYESTKALAAENSALKLEISRAETRLMAKDQKDCFPAVRAEQKRIALAIRKDLLPEDAEYLLFKLALGDIQ